MFMSIGMMIFGKCITLEAKFIFLLTIASYVNPNWFQVTD